MTVGADMALFVRWQYTWNELLLSGSPKSVAFLENQLAEIRWVRPLTPTVQA